ncbi:hypothetical protein DW687_08610 [Anaerofustis stercorihominis]|uniref:Uncharacterized protein n=1 Tax=Anaerofustis stercorihominis TaxID=214853 RepID=A0A3E3DX30_9FIRM|nr:hypothetical protein DW687_08610 [Anaerofustis stercorihominis]
MKHMIKHFKLWNQWRKVNLNSKFYKFMVLIRLANSPSFEIYYKYTNISNKPRSNNDKKIQN